MSTSSAENLVDYAGTHADNRGRKPDEGPMFVIDRTDDGVQERLLELCEIHTASNASDLGPEARVMLDRIISILRQTGGVRLWSVFRLHFQGNSSGFRAACEAVLSVEGVSLFPPDVAESASSGNIGSAAHTPADQIYGGHVLRRA